MKKNKKKDEFVDDGRVIADMDVDGLPWQGRSRRKKNKPTDDSLPTFKEKWAIILGAYRAFLPVLLVLVGTLLVMMLIAFVWLR